MADKRLSFALGLAQKAGRAVSGDFAVRGALKGGTVELLLLAQDAAPNTKKELLFLAQQAQVPVLEVLSREELGLAIGRAQRAAVAVTDSSFAGMLNKIISK